MKAFSRSTEDAQRTRRIRRNDSYWDSRQTNPPTHTHTIHTHSHTLNLTSGYMPHMAIKYEDVRTDIFYDLRKSNFLSLFFSLLCEEEGSGAALFSRDQADLWLWDAQTRLRRSRWRSLKMQPLFLFHEPPNKIVWPICWKSGSLSELTSVADLAPEEQTQLGSAAISTVRIVQSTKHGGKSVGFIHQENKTKKKVLFEEWNDSCSRVPPRLKIHGVKSYSITSDC